MHTSLLLSCLVDPAFMLPQASDVVVVPTHLHAEISWHTVRGVNCLRVSIVIAENREHRSGQVFLEQSVDAILGVFGSRGQPPGEPLDPSRRQRPTFTRSPDGLGLVALAGFGFGNSLVVSKGVTVGGSQNSEERLLQIACPASIEVLIASACRVKTAAGTERDHGIRHQTGCQLDGALSYLKASNALCAFDYGFLLGPGKVCDRLWEVDGIRITIRNGVGVGEITREGDVENWVVQCWLRLLSRGNWHLRVRPARQAVCQPWDPFYLAPHCFANHQCDRHYRICRGHRGSLCYKCVALSSNGMRTSRHGLTWTASPDGLAFSIL
ncbi:hypothetical protein KC356_g72 [Hortaea werneckii]|nr:hypothetical protein KC356_g72 [Hortaea werneckii]